KTLYWPKIRNRQPTAMRSPARARSFRSRTRSWGGISLFLAAVLHDIQDAALHVSHHRIRPQLRIPIEVRLYPMTADQPQPRRPVIRRFDDVFPVEHIEVGAADGDVFVECCGRDVLCVRADGETQSLLRLPLVDGFDEQ